VVRNARVVGVGEHVSRSQLETTLGSFKTEQIRRHGPWRDLAEIEVAAFEWVDFFNTDRAHEYLDDLTPCQAEELHYAHRNTLAPTSVTG
jgi:putative transposase